MTDRMRTWAQGKSWEVEARDPKPDAPVHPSVEERFAAGPVIRCDGLKPYRPDVLARHDRVGHYYAEAAPAGDSGLRPDGWWGEELYSWREAGRGLA